jgi:type I restriction enzyme S subunit
MTNNIPQLRFSEFEEKWDEKKFHDIVIDYKLGGNYKNTDVKTELPLIKMGNIKRGHISIAKLEYIPISESVDEEDKIKYGDLFFNTRNTLELVGKVAVWRDELQEAYYNSNLMRITFSNNFFMNYRFNSYQGIKGLRRLATGTTSVAAIYTKDLLKLKLTIPENLPEQEKIAEFLTAVDKRINLLEEKKKSLEQYKKGVMQKVFDGKCEMVDGQLKFQPPTIRFKNEDGNDFPDWEEKKLGDLGKTFNGLTGKTKVDFGEGKPYIQYMQIFRSSKLDVSDFGLVNIKDGENQSQAQYGDVFFTTSSETPKEIGISSVLTEQVKEVYLNSFCFGYRPNCLDELVPEFAQFFFRSEKVRKQIVKLAQGSTRFNMSKVALLKLKFDFPEKDEQQKIADFLSSIDKLIEKVDRQINLSQEWKKGLLQKMFV